MAQPGRSFVHLAPAAGYRNGDPHGLVRELSYADRSPCPVKALLRYPLPRYENS